MLFGAYIDNKLIGTASIFIYNNVAGFYDDLTLEKFRKQGVISALYNTKIEYLIKRHIKTIVIQTSPEATNLAKNIGFKEYLNYKMYMHN